ncbi:FUN14 superfamily domain-containing protein [Histoplasma ohiense]|nr:FUN14 superfamily domain-containing protein [Histoplasma ohiense (nom. inval.)]
MAAPFLTRFLTPAARPFLFAAPLGLSLSLALPKREPILCDFAGPFATTSHSHYSTSPVSKAKRGIRSGGGINENTVRQLSLGSVLGLLAGFGLRIFSRALVFALGLTVLGVEWAASKGYNVVPTRWLRERVRSANLQRFLTENVPFKVSFGTMMMLAAFAQF